MDTSDTLKPEPILWLDGARGRYIPRDFAESFANRDQDVAGVSDEHWAVLEAGPDHEHYWDVWDLVEFEAIVTDENGTKYHVYQNGDCWLVPVGMKWNDMEDGYTWE